MRSLPFCDLNVPTPSMTVTKSRFRSLMTSMIGSVLVTEHEMPFFSMCSVSEIVLRPMNFFQVFQT